MMSLMMNGFVDTNVSPVSEDKLESMCKSIGCDEETRKGLQMVLVKCSKPSFDVGSSGFLKLSGTDKVTKPKNK